MTCGFCLVMPALPARKEYPPYGYCEGCGGIARVWKCNERIVTIGAGFAVVEGEGYCKECISLALRLADMPEDD